MLEPFWQSDLPKQTVELFEKLLPYAMVLGVENEWAKQFADIYTTPPYWYNGNWNTFNAVYLTSSLTNSVGAMSTNFSAPSNSGGSGFSGGRHSCRGGDSGELGNSGLPTKTKDLVVGRLRLRRHVV